MFSKDLFGQRISKLRKKNGERQEDLAAVLSLGKTAVCEIEKGNSDVYKRQAENTSPYPHDAEGSVCSGRSWYDSLSGNFLGLHP